MSWLSELLKECHIDETFKRLGLEFSKVFPNLEEMENNPYRNHTWVVKENQDYLVINAIPEKYDQDNLIWEEWYLHSGEVHHHILSLWEPQSYQEIFQAPESDDIHPPQCFSQKWYVIEDSDMRALLLRR